MVRNAELSEADKKQIESGGGLKKRTEMDRDITYNSFITFISERGFLGDAINEIDNSELEELIWTYFFTMRVEPKGEEARKPKWNTAKKALSDLKNALLIKDKINIGDALQFPNLGKKMKAFKEQIADEGLSHTDHYEEIAADSMDKIYKLIYNTYKALEHRGNPDLLQIHLAEIPPAFHNRLNYLAQYGCQLIVTMLDLRRGCENIEKLKVSGFVKFEDKNWKITYWKKVTGEKEKNHKGGDQDVRNNGFIPYMDVSPYFNPGIIFEKYLKFLPDSDNTLLFCKPMLPSSKFNVMDPEVMTLYYPQPVGKHTISKMLPELCLAAGTERHTNHQGN